MCTSTPSSPLPLYSTSLSQIIPSTEISETSFHTIVSPSPTLLPQDKKRCLSQRAYNFLTLFCLLFCLAFLIYLTIHVNVYMKWSGGFSSNLTIPSLGNFSVALHSEEVLNVSSQVNSNLKVGSENSEPVEMWKQVYLDDFLS